MYRTLLYILVCIPALLHAQAEKWLEGYDSLLKVTTAGIEIYDLTADSTIFAYNEHQTLRPASTMKLTTATAALDILGGSYKFLTTMKCSGKIRPSGSDRRRNVLQGDVTLIGGMDPCFGSSDMQAFIDTLRILKIDTIYGNILEDKMLKDTLLLGSGWCWDDPNPQLTPLLYKGKDIFMQSFKDSLAASNICVIPAKASDTIDGQSVSERHTVPLGGQEGRIPSEGVLYATRSHTMNQVLIPMLKNSSNLYAEALFYQLSPTNRRSPLFTGHASKHPTARDIAHTLDTLVQEDIYGHSSPRRDWEGTFSDGSGLSLYNYQSADYQVRLLRYAYQHPEIYRQLYPALPVAGVDGTLAKRMKGTAAEGNVHAKTGTVTGVSSLAGYLTAGNGHLFCFSIITQGCLRSRLARDLQDRLCVMMCETR